MSVRAWVLATTLLLLAGCGGQEPAAVPVDPTAERSALRYADTGLVSLNHQCPATGDPLSAAIEPIYANGRPIGFC